MSNTLNPSELNSCPTLYLFIVLRTLKMINVQYLCKMFDGHLNVHWTFLFVQWTNGHLNVQWTFLFVRWTNRHFCMSNGHFILSNGHVTFTASLRRATMTSGADLGFFTHQSNTEGVSHARGVRGHAPPGKF